MYLIGIDRLDNSKSHIIENCVTACKYCNYLKGSYSYDEFIDWLKLINFNRSKFTFNKIEEYNIEQYALVNDVYRHYSNDTDIDIYTFSKLIKEPCYYCNRIGVNNRKDFKYNGMDRIDSTSDHRLSNVVPCCKVCNYSKKDFTLDEWYDQIQNVKTHLSL